MPNRMIKDSIHTSDKVNAMTDFQFRLWVNLIAYVDDYGRGDARPAIIKGSCFPLRERLTLKEIDTALSGLAGIGCVVLYEVDGRPYLCFPNWEKHQTIRNKRSKYPAPPENCNQLQSIEINCNQLNANVPVIQSNPIQVETELESKGKGVQRFAPPTPAEAAEYHAEKGFSFSLDAWLSYYEANGWTVNGRKMKDWRASMRYWQSKEADRPKPKLNGGQQKPFSIGEEMKKQQMENMKKLNAMLTNGEDA